MIVDRVNFNEEEVLKMDRDEFIRLHSPLLWNDRDADTRAKMLGDAYDRMAKARQKRKTEK